MLIQYFLFSSRHASLHHPLTTAENAGENNKNKNTEKRIKKPH